ncbi:unnamed protein product [Phyllotreta striolata]|uniref:Serine/threonine-protein kinase RIO3 n=1 Tax=Phyllotreta striolata TaxID=444603 RepID=A0A9N9XPU2_PHYSR|nr:unnamed protein product [Phyllotreta striolata]
MSSPWAKIDKPEPINLDDIMSEEVARELQAKEEKNLLKHLHPGSNDNVACSEEPVDIPDEILKAISDDSFESDEAIAKLLQMQFDKEYDEELKRVEGKYNGTSKVSISFDNYRRVPLNQDFLSDSEDEEIVDIRDRKDWDRFDSLKKEFNSIPQCGYKTNKDGKMITKHDGVMSGRNNACKLLSFPPEFQTGDGETFDLKLSNKVFNSLKLHSNKEQVRRHKLNDKKEDQATAEFGIDEYTRLILYKLINNQLLEKVNGVISIGKEAVILHADTDPGFPFDPDLPKECVLKVFKTTLAEFKQRDKYIKDDHRFKDRIGKQTARKTVHIWAEKEMANLMRLAKSGIPCPKVVTLKKHVLVMSFIGDDHKPAPKLKDAILSDADYMVAYDEVIEGMKALYDKANLIHADLSEYNILWHEDKCYFIDVSQSVEPSHENAFHFLLRDCNNVLNFFSKKGVPEVMSPEELFESITGCKFQDKVALDTIRESFKLKPHLVNKPGVELNYNFDTAWKKAKSKEMPQVEVVLPVENVLDDVDIAPVEPAKA